MIAMGEPIRVLQSVAAMDMGGIENFIMNLYRTIDRSEVQFDFLYAVDKSCYFDEEIRSLGGRIFTFQSPNKHPITARAFYDSLFRDHPEIKILHEHSSALKGNLASFSSAKSAGIQKRAIHSHSSSTTYADGIQGLVMRANVKRNAFRIESLATDFFACSDTASDWMFPNRINSGIKVEILKNGVDAERFMFNRDSRLRVRKELGIGDQTFVIGNVARLNSVKNHIFLLELLEVLINEIDASLIIVGDGPLYDSLKHEAVARGLSDHVFLVGAKNNPASYYSAMDLLCMPSLYEGLPVSCVEAQCSGLPLLLSDTVSRDAAFTDNAIFQSLSSGAKEWAESAVSLYSLSNNREEGLKATISAGFDINETAAFLQKYYLS